MSEWIEYDGGKSLGQTGAEGGVILRDEENKLGARITIKRGKDYVSVSCNIYGRIDHTRFFATVSDAQREYLMMKSFLSQMLITIQSAEANDIKVWEAISEFVRRFP